MYFLDKQQKDKFNDINDKMLDLYLIITPLAGLLTLFTLINLKLTLGEPKPKDLSKYQKKNSVGPGGNIEIQPSHNHQIKEETTQPGYRKTLLYLLKNFTIADFCLIRRSRNKLPLLLTLPIIAILQITLNIAFVFSIVGTLVTLIFIGVKVLTDQDQQQVQDSLRAKEKITNHNKKFQQKLQLIFTFLALILDVVLIAFTFKNYKNQLLQSAAINFLVNIALDNFVVKPLLLLLVAYPTKNIQFIDAFIDKETQIVEILHQQRVPIKIFDAVMPALTPKKLVNSPTKLYKTINIEARIKEQNKQNYLSTISLTKAPKNPKLSPINSKKILQVHNSDDCSLISIMNSHQKKKNQRIQKNSPFELDKSIFDEKVLQENQPIPQGNADSKKKQDEQSQCKYSIDGSKKNGKMKSSKLIMINQDNSIIRNFQNEIQNKQEQDINQNKSTHNQKSLKDSDYKTSGRNCDGLKISLHKSIDYALENKQNFDAFFEEQANPNVGRPHSSFQEDSSILQYGTITHTSRRDGLLKINEDRKGQDLEQIDLNSPQRRKQQVSKIAEYGDVEKPKKKKGHKKYSLDPNRHVIKHSTGQPYLEFLPNLLNNQRQQKKKRLSQQGSQEAFSRKMEGMLGGHYNESRISKSVKRPKNSQNYMMKENDENKVPEFLIEDFN